jgi:hypothetical protein
MDPYLFEERKKRENAAEIGGLFAHIGDSPPTAGATRRAARATQSPHKQRGDAARVAEAIDGQRERGATRKEIAALTGIPKDTVNQRVGRDLRPGKPGSGYLEPYTRNGEKVIVARKWFAGGGA